MNSQALLSALLADEQGHISLLQRFVQAPSPAPPGDTRAAAAVIREYLVSEHGIPVDVIAPQEHMPNLVAEFTCGGGGGDGGAIASTQESGHNKRGSRLVLNGHIDVFPVGDGHGADWDRDPWSGELVDGRIHGRGTVDMKAGMIASVVAFAYLYRFREFLPGREGGGRGSVALCCVSDEETGGKYGTRWLLDHGRDGVEKLQSLEEAEEDEGGEEGKYGTNGKKEQKQSPWLGDVMINAEPGGPNVIRFAEKGTLRLTFTVDVGPGAHGAFTHKSASATKIAARVICDLAVVEEIKPDLDPKLKEYLKREDVRRAIDECMGPGAADIATECTLNIGTIHGGLKVNMIPGSCVFEGDIRMPLGLEAGQVMEVVHGVLAKPEYANQVKVEIQKPASNPASASEHDHPMVEILARQAERVSWGEKEKKKRPLAIPSLGATDCKFYRYKGTPAYVFGVSPDGMGAKNESVSVKEFLGVLRTHALAGWEYLGGQA